MKDPFGTATSMIVLSADRAEPMAKRDAKDNKKANLVKIYLAAVPSLEDAKDALVEISDSVEDQEIKGKVEEFINSIFKITEDILDLTKVAVRGVRQQAQEQAQPQAQTQTTTPAPAPQQQKITPEMISG
jgi:hypothetical protein